MALTSARGFARMIMRFTQFGGHNNAEHECCQRIAVTLHHETDDVETGKGDDGGGASTSYLCKTNALQTARSIIKPYLSRGATNWG